MPTVETVRGPIDVDALGRVLMHEHVFTLGTEIRQNYPQYPDPWDEEVRVADAVQQLTDMVARGITSIVDPTVIGLGRYIPRIQRINEQVDLNIVVATGVYTYSDAPIQFHFTGPGRIFDTPVDPMTELFVKDIREGIADTDVKAGLLKCAIDEHGLTPDVERVMRAVAQAHVETGTPITVHTHAHDETGLIVERVLGEEGVDLSKVVIAHSGDSTDIDYLRKLADAGAILGMDRFGIDAFCPFEDRVATVATLAALGYAEKMVLAHDASCYSDFYPEALRKAALPRWRFTHVSDDVLPALRERGVSDDQITTMLVENPRIYFSGAHR
ncbi:phosphotriesterase-related protein [Tsukamurella sp. 8F]|uniref:phosphotriesterase family protein n=1 Tax=unclassified Tsukamurella TaxID=2633480 RepID=UPI0023BA1976|nr:MULTISPECIES: phosphotriesterase-related protein [unclassified Tsukamurella]MDF0529344.1 phosphotriesterase-related protein [Tsukamurella sp. 8J]MDF0587149.1 phosphotriesterase-related protein [Tsukamurella sp. 8F]